MQRTKIEWTDFSWNPIRARVKPEHVSNPAYKPAHSGTFCTRISPGCTNCYASVINKRFGNGLEYTVPNLEKIEFFIDQKILFEPLRRKQPARIFVGDMFDLFHESIPDQFLIDVLGIALLGSWHTFQFLTKRADRMMRFMRSDHAIVAQFSALRMHGGMAPGEVFRALDRGGRDEKMLQWPPPNCHFGVSVEDAKRAIERVPLLQMTPAVVRFLSVEPQLEDINFTIESPEVGLINLLRGFDGCDPVIPGIDWVICGGESGPGARPFNLVWAESLLAQCKAASVPFFMKQVGSAPFYERTYPPMHRESNNDGLKIKIHVDGAQIKRTYKLRDRKGGDMSEWPESLRVREFPASQKREAVSA